MEPHPRNSNVNAENTSQHQPLCLLFPGEFLKFTVNAKLWVVNLTNGCFTGVVLLLVNAIKDQPNFPNFARRLGRRRTRRCGSSRRPRRPGTPPRPFWRMRSPRCSEAAKRRKNWGKTWEKHGLIREKLGETLAIYAKLRISWGWPSKQMLFLFPWF